ncbi:DUF2157 domain-containing protein [Tunicatimonas pelagia]|uniref:DUF2157 domain-containing protein n=1 Tax=Tunicatimonas pelagia TaxID=931531 RepID=UPI0026668B3E|nr:DUF2157 domain-containing protein [Tunicatimonas pelagia]WKN43476.1 DUF2157 domain-containing protein [Tunicatimonas pelagia]
MQFTEEQHRTLQQAIRQWEEQQLISTATAEALRQSYQIKESTPRFDWKNLSLIAFFFAIACIVLATALFLVDDWLMSVVNRVLGASALTKCALFLILSLVTFMLGVRRRRKYPSQKYSNEALLIFGAIFIAFFLTYLSEALQMEEGNFPVFVGLATIAYGAIAIYLKSHLLWGISLTALATWYGIETFYLSNEASYFLGMNLPLRYVFFGLLLIAGSIFVKKVTATRAFFSVTYYSGMLVLFSSLWLLSIFGNQTDLSVWGNTPQYQFWYATLLLSVFSLGAIWWGLNRQERLTAEIGILFFLLNIYTRYFEYGWDSLHRVIFFGLLALSFWFIGKKAESIWNRLEKD